MVDISKIQQLTPKQSKWMINTTGQRENMQFWGELSQYNYRWPMYEVFVLSHPVFRTRKPDQWTGVIGCKHECPWMILGPHDGVEELPCDI